MILENRESFLIPAEKIATVMCGNPLEHVLLVLSKVGYSKIPVLDRDDHFVGLVSLTAVVNKMLEATQIDPTNLIEGEVLDIMEKDVTTISDEWELEDVLHDLVNVAFIPVVDDKEVFKGLITRREILKAVNHAAHTLDQRYEVTEKVQDKLTAS
jgi:predicted transcriptional regulator